LLPNTWTENDLLIPDVFYKYRKMIFLSSEVILFRSEKIESFTSKMEKQKTLPQSIIDYGLHVQEVDIWLRYI
jgi:hypothetical protein